MSQPSETDCITELPNDILSSIFNRLTVSDAFRASHVSKQWTDIPPYMLRLDFDMLSMFNIPPYPFTMCFPSYRVQLLADELRSDSLVPYADKFVKWVNHFLELHKRVQIEDFTVTFAFNGKKHQHDLDRWVVFALRKGVKHLTLTLDCDVAIYDNVTFRGSYWLSSKVFSQCNGLLSLSVYVCRVESGLGFHFPNLKSLKLSMILIGSQQLEDLLLSCLNLETLTLDHIKDLYCIRIPHTLNRLKYLQVLDSRSIHRFQTCATNLEYFHQNCFAPEIVTFSSPASRLRNVSFLVYSKKSIMYAYGQLAYDMPQLESLTMTVKIFEARAMPTKIATFSKLKHLHFAMIAYRNFDAIRITDLLKACPILEKFLMEVCSIYPKENIIRRLPFDYGVHKCLKDVRIVGFTSGKLHVEIASYLLQYCVALERMVFEPVKRREYETIEFTPFKWGEYERAYVWSRLKKHPRISLITMMQ